MKFIVSYDIEPDGVRRRVAEILECFGTRIQRSVFDCDLDEAGLKDLVGKLRRALKEDRNGNLRFYRVCRHCLEASFGLGGIDPPEEEEPCIILD